MVVGRRPRNAASEKSLRREMRRSGRLSSGKPPTMFRTSWMDDLELSVSKLSLW